MTKNESGHETKSNPEMEEGEECNEEERKEREGQDVFAPVRDSSADERNNSTIRTSGNQSTTEMNPNHPVLDEEESDAECSPETHDCEMNIREHHTRQRRTRQPPDALDLRQCTQPRTWFGF